MTEFDPSILKQLYVPSSDSHKAQNGKVLLIGGSHLFHAASLWSLQIASRIVDMVFYSSVDENNEIVARAKEEFRNGIVVPRNQLGSYIKEADCILIGPGLVRTENPAIKYSKLSIQGLDELDAMHDEGEQTYYLTKYLLEKYPEKKFIIDAGSLQMMRPEWLLTLKETPILTPHKGEFKTLFGVEETNESASEMARKFGCVIIGKGVKDIIASPSATVVVSGGNVGMTKGGTGDVLAGLAASLYAKNDAWLCACAASYINKKAGDSLFEKVGPYFNASDLVDEIPQVLHHG